MSSSAMPSLASEWPPECRRRRAAHRRRCGELLEDRAIAAPPRPLAKQLRALAREASIMGSRAIIMSSPEQACAAEVARFHQLHAARTRGGYEYPARRVYQAIGEAGSAAWLPVTAVGGVKGACARSCQWRGERHQLGSPIQHKERASIRRFRPWLRHRPLDAAFHFRRTARPASPNGDGWRAVRHRDGERAAFAGRVTSHQIR